MARAGRATRQGGVCRRVGVAALAAIPAVGLASALVLSTAPMASATAGPVFSGATSATFLSGAYGAATISASDATTPTFTESGALPSGIVFTDEGNGTAKIAGTSATAGSYSVTVTASATDGTTSENFTLFVGKADNVAFSYTGSAQTFAVPSFVDSIEVDAAGSQGGASPNGGGVGGRGGRVVGTVSVTPGSTITVDVGGQGAPGSLSGSGGPGGWNGGGSGGLGAAGGGGGGGGGGASDVKDAAGTVLAVAPGGGGASYTANGGAGGGLDGQAGPYGQGGQHTGGGGGTQSVGGAAGGNWGASGDGTATSGGNGQGNATSAGGGAGGGGLFGGGGGGWGASGGGGSALVPKGGTTTTGYQSGNGYVVISYLTQTTPPTITSTSSTSFAEGTPGSFTVSTTGLPTPTLTESGSLPSGVTFVDNGDGTASIAGTPTQLGAFPITITAANGSTTSATQAFTLTVTGAVAFLSGDATTLTEGSAADVTVQTSGYPYPAITESGALLPGLSFVDNGNGTATISGTPTSTGVRDLTLSASNGTTSATQSYSLVVQGPPTIITPQSAAFATGAASSFVVATVGTPTPSLTETGALPPGVSFVDNGNGTASLSGTASTAGSFPLTISASNGFGAAATQSFTLEVGAQSTFSSAASTTFSVGQPGTFTVRAGGTPTPSLTETGTLPAGLAFVDNGNGTASISGTPSVAGLFEISLTADSGGSLSTQSFSLIVDAVPSITSPASTSFVSGQGGTFTVAATGYPTPSLTETGTLPAGLAFVDNGNGTASISGTPSGASGTIDVTVTAGNGVGTAATQTLAISVDAPASVVTPGPQTLSVGSAVDVGVTTTGYPLPHLFVAGALPAGVSFTDNGDGTGTFAGTPTTSGAGAVSIVATNGIGAPSIVPLSFTIDGAPAITSSSGITLTVGDVAQVALSATGYPAPSFSATGTLPPGLSLSAAGMLSGTPTAPGAYPLTVTATNGVAPAATQSLEVTVIAAPAITSAASATFTAGTAASFTVTTSGTPAAHLSESGALPAGLAFTDNGDGTATISGTPSGGGTTAIAVLADNPAGAADQLLTITVDAAATFTSAASIVLDAGTPFVYDITTSGSYPPPVLSVTGTLPSGVSFTDNGDGTGYLSGTAASSTTAASYPVTFVATSTGAQTAEQAATITVQLPGAPVNCPAGDTCGASGRSDASPVLTSAASTSFGVGVAGSFAVEATGYPLPSLSESGTLPAGVTFIDNGDGTGSLSGTPTASGTYPVSFSASNGASTTTQDFTLTVTAAPAFVGTPSATLTASTADSVTVVTSGYPAPAISESGALPAGIAFTDNGNGTASFTGTPSASGETDVTLTATSPAGTTSEDFVLGVDAPLSITSPASATLVVGASAGFAVTASGFPAPTFAVSGSLPPGTSFSPAGVLSGAPTAAGIYPVTVTASNAAGSSATQALTIAVEASSLFAGSGGSSGSSGSGASVVDATVGTSFSHTVTASGATALTESGTLPAGVSFVDNGNGTATLSGTPASGSAGVYDLLLDAKTATASTQESIVVIVSGPATITSPNAALLAYGQGAAFQIGASGYPAPTFSETGTLPSGLSLSPSGEISGTPSAWGMFPVTVSASNGAGTDATQTLFIYVYRAPHVRYDNWHDFRSGSDGSETIQLEGFPLPKLDTHVDLPKGLHLVDNGDGTATLSGTPAPGHGGIFDLLLSASSTKGTATTPVSVAVDSAPIVTAPPSYKTGSGERFSTVVPTTGGWPLPHISAEGGLPPGLSLHDNGDGTATISGTPSRPGDYSFSLNADSGSGLATIDNMTLVVTGVSPSVGIGGGGAPAPGGATPAPGGVAPGQPTPYVPAPGTGVPTAPVSSGSRPSAPVVLVPARGSRLSAALTLALPTGPASGRIVVRVEHGKAFVVVGTGSYLVTAGGTVLAVQLDARGRALLATASGHLAATVFLHDGSHVVAQALSLLPAATLAAHVVVSARGPVVRLACSTQCSGVVHVALLENGRHVVLASATAHLRLGGTGVVLSESPSGKHLLARAARGRSLTAHVAVSGAAVLSAAVRVTVPAR